MVCRSISSWRGRTTADNRDRLGAAAAALPACAGTVLRDGKVDAVIGDHIAAHPGAMLVRRLTAIRRCAP